MPRTVRKKSSSPKTSIEGRPKLRARRRKRNPEDNANEVEVNKIPMEDRKIEKVGSPKVDTKTHSARRGRSITMELADNAEDIVNKVENDKVVLKEPKLEIEKVESPKVSKKQSARRSTIKFAMEPSDDINEVEINEISVEKPKEEIESSKVDKHRSARRSIKDAIELANSGKKEATIKNDPSNRRITRSVSRLSIQVETPKSNPSVCKKRVSRRLSISDVSGVFEMESETMIIDPTLPSSSGEEIETKIEDGQSAIDTTKELKNETYSPTSPKFAQNTEIRNDTTPKSANRSHRRSSRFFGNESLVLESDPITEAEITTKSPKQLNSIKNETFSPKSPKFLMDLDLPSLPASPVDEIEVQIRRQTSTPYFNNIKSVSTKKSSRRLDDSIILQQSATPRSIIKKKIKDKIGVSPIMNANNKENEVQVSFITTRKRRSINESMDISLVSAKRSRVTFHPNTSVFRIENGTDETPDKNAEGTDGGNESNVCVDLLNDLNEYPGIEPPKTPKKDEDVKGDQVVILNETFTPEDNKLLRAVDSIKKKQSPKRRLSRKSTLTPGIQKLNISTAKKKNPVSAGKKNNSTYSVETGSMVKEFKARKTPNFASIHKKNTARMESLVDNHERKQERARKLFEWNGTSNNETKSLTTAEETRVLRTTNQSLNRFGFNVKAASERKQRMKDIAMKKINRSEQKIKSNIRECVKGVRSNRRFDLLMQSRNID